MKKINFYPGGQPFRSTDFKTLQDNQLLGFKSILNAIRNTSSPLILTGVEASIHPQYEGKIRVSPGVVFNGAEICSVIGAEGMGSVADVYLRAKVQNSSIRPIAGNNQYIFTEDYFEPIITTEPLPTDIPLSSFSRIIFICADDYEMQLVHEDTIENGEINIYANELGDVLIKATYKQLSTVNTYQLPERVVPDYIVSGCYTCQNAVKPLTINTTGLLTLTGLQVNDEIDIYLCYKKTLPK